MARTSPGGKGTNRWTAHPVLSWILRASVLVIPMAAGVVTASAFSRAVPVPPGSRALGWWALLLASSGLAVWAVDRVARRLLPLAILLRLTLLFPDRAPSRFAIARRVGSPRKLQEQVRLARKAGAEDDPSRAAEMVLALVAALSAHDRKTRGHSERVRVLTDLLAAQMRIPERKRDRLRWAALLHDIGKLEVSARILNKPEKPDRREWNTLKHHPEAGARLTGPLLDWLGEWGPAIEQHHERFDGSGYPDGLSGKEICRGARILAVTDSFETMTAPRSYRKPVSVAAAREELIRCAGSQFDPAVVRAFLNVSLGRLWLQVGPLAWLVQLPFLSIRTAGDAARTGIAAVAKATVGAVALGAGSLTASPAMALRVPTLSAPAEAGSAQTDQPGEDGPSRDGDEGEGADTSEAAVTDESEGATATTDDGTASGAGGGDGDGDGRGSGGDPTDSSRSTAASAGTGDAGSTDASGGSDGGSDGKSGDGFGVPTSTDAATDLVEDTASTAGGVADGAAQTVGDVAEGTGKVLEDLTEGPGKAAGDLLS